MLVRLLDICLTQYHVHLSFYFFVRPSSSLSFCLSYSLYLSPSLFFFLSFFPPFPSLSCIRRPLIGGFYFCPMTTKTLYDIIAFYRVLPFHWERGGVYFWGCFQAPRPEGVEVENHPPPHTLRHTQTHKTCSAFALTRCVGLWLG